MEENNKLNDQVDNLKEKVTYKIEKELLNEFYEFCRKRGLVKQDAVAMAIKYFMENYEKIVSEGFTLD